MAQVRKRLIDCEGSAATAAARRVLRVVEAPPAPPLPRLTRREHECLGWCAEGKSYWETAVILGISERTVSFHMEAVRGKLKAASNAHAVARAMRAGQLGPCAKPGRPLHKALQ